MIFFPNQNKTNSQQKKNPKLPQHDVSIFSQAECMTDNDTTGDFNF